MIEWIRVKSHCLLKGAGHKSTRHWTNYHPKPFYYCVCGYNEPWFMKSDNLKEAIDNFCDRRGW